MTSNFHNLQTNKSGTKRHKNFKLSTPSIFYYFTPSSASTSPRLAAFPKHLSRPSRRANPIRLFTSSSPSQLARKMTTLTGSCYCRNITYKVSLNSRDDARTSLCHCRNCKKAFGTNYGLTAKIPKDALKITRGKTKEHSADNGSGMVIHREFCDHCGSFILEYGVSLVFFLET